MTEKYKFHTDPGHGWLQVSRAEVERLGIAGDISCCSYESSDGKTLFLEEDCDATRFIDAKRAAGQEFKARHVETRHVDYDHPIRNMAPFTREGMTHGQHVRRVG